MRVRQQQLIYGAVFGASAFLAGWAITFLLTPQGLISGVPQWKVTLWVFLSANFVKISGLQVNGFSGAFTQIDLVSQLPALRSLRVVPFLLTALGGIMMVEKINYTTQMKYLIQNSGSLLVGYLTAGLLGFVISGAQPGVAFIMIVAVVVALAAIIGSTLTQNLMRGVPVIGFTSIGGIVAIGLLVILGGVAVIQSFGPLVVVSCIGVSAGAALAWIARNA